MVRLSLLLFVLFVGLLSPRASEAEPSVLPAAPLRTAFGSRCARSPIPCNRIDYFTAHFHLADIVLLPSTDSRGFGATIGYGMSMSLFHRLEVGIGGTLSLWNQPTQGLHFQNGPALLNVKGVLFPLLRNPLPDTEFTFGLQLQQQLRIPKFEGPNDLGTLSPLTALRAVADKPFWRMGITGSLGFLLTQGRTDSELAASIRLHIPGMSRATVQTFGVLQGLFGSSRTAPLRGGFGLSVHFAWDNGTSLSAGYLYGRGNGTAPTAIYLGGPDYHIGRETSEQSYSRPPIPNREMVPSPWPWLIDKLRQEWNEAEAANEAHRQGQDWLTEECFLYEEGKYDKPLRHLGKRDASGKLCHVGGRLVPMDEPLREVGTELVPVRSPSSTSTPEIPSTPLAVPPLAPKPQTEAPVRPAGSQETSRAKRRKPQRAAESAARLAEAQPAPVTPPLVAPTPSPQTTASTPQRVSPGLAESASQLAQGMAAGVLEQSTILIEETKQLPGQLAQQGRELVEDVREGRPLRALVPLRAVTHAIRNAKVEDVERLAEATVEGAKEWWDKPPFEKGRDVGRAATTIASDAAITVLTEGLGTLHKLRKLEKAADKAEDAVKTAKTIERAEDAAKATRQAERLEEAAESASSTRIKEPHRNRADDRPATLYEKYDRHGDFEKHGVTHHENPEKRYTKKEIDKGRLDSIERGPRKEMLAKERDRVETHPGPHNKEPWAGRRKASSDDD